MASIPCEDRPRRQGSRGMRFGVDFERAASVGSAGHDRPTPLFWTQEARNGPARLRGEENHEPAWLGGWALNFSESFTSQPSWSIVLREDAKNKNSTIRWAEPERCTQAPGLRTGNPTPTGLRGCSPGSPPQFQCRMCPHCWFPHKQEAAEDLVSPLRRGCLMRLRG